MNKAEIRDRLNQIKVESGTHSPSISTILREIPEIKVQIDACFLSNPYATELLYSNIKKDLIETDKLRDVIEFYPAQNNDVAKIIGKATQISANKIFVGNGAAEIIQATIHTFGGSKILVNVPTFSAYYEFALPHQAIIHFALKKEENFNLNIEEYVAFIQKEKPTAVVLINPNNPDGGYLSNHDIEEIIERTKHIVGCFILDESFIHFAYEDPTLTPINSEKLIDKYPHLILIKSMSKDFGIAGIRSGYAIMKEERRKMLTDHGYLWNISGLSEYFFTLYANEKFGKEYDVVRRKYIMNTKMFLHEIGEIANLKVYPSKANFALVEIKNGMTSFEFASELLLGYGIYVRDCSDKIGLNGEFIRVASRSFEENLSIISALQEVAALGPNSKTV